MVDGTPSREPAPSDSQDSGTNISLSELDSSASHSTLKSRTSSTSENDTEPAGRDTARQTWFIFSPRRWGLRLIPVSWWHPEHLPDGRFKKLHFESVDDYPKGYPAWAAFQNSDPTFRVYRRYGTLRNRVILHKQQELAGLETSLNELDEEDSNSKENKGRLGSLRRDKEDDSKRIILMTEIEKKLKEYDDLLAREARSGAMRRAPKRNFRTLVNYLWNEKPVSRREMQFLTLRDDFVILSDEGDSTLETVLDWFVCRIPIKFVRRQFSSEDQLDKLKDDAYVFTSATRLAGAVRIFAIAMAILLIGVPIYFLNFGSCSLSQKRSIVLISVVLFPAIVQVTARTKNHEMFAITAAYCAVLTACLATTTNYVTQSQGQELSAAPIVTEHKRWGEGWLF
ncbi:hypothetical protein EJ04DRAFT_130378 [Polyplosphaeria fusca]|uniref:DUF6594 domain-containing protein n=1 Tax=Polyplosphaeria fusca TaxID=682080 RepID=A0A9P4R0Z4_9PLEO|nr:hypothetical protein EJ04DRAFT_130378 [Polyplosphaeria fusca]